MKRYLPLGAGISAFIVLVLMWGTEESGYAAARNMSFEHVYDNLDPAVNTELHVREFWKSIDGAKVVWSGVVRDVKGGRGRAKIFLHNGSRPATRNYNIVVVTFNVKKAAALKPGQKISVSGFIANYRKGKPRGIVLFLDNGEIR